MADIFENFAVAVVKGITAPAADGTTIELQPGQGSRFPTVPFTATIWPSAALPDPVNAELVRVVYRNGDLFSIVRGHENTAHRVVQPGDLFAQTLTKATVDNYAKRDESNLFAADQYVSRQSHAIEGAILFGAAGTGYLYRQTDGVFVLAGGMLQVQAPICDYSRTVPIGDWTDVPLNVSEFSFPVTTLHHHAYTRIGHTLTWALTVDGTVPAATNVLSVLIPAGVIPTRPQSGSMGRVSYSAGGFAPSWWLTVANDNRVYIYRTDGATLPAGATVQLGAVLTLRA